MELGRLNLHRRRIADRKIMFLLYALCAVRVLVKDGREREEVRRKIKDHCQHR